MKNQQHVGACCDALTARSLAFPLSEQTPFLADHLRKSLR
jgi:hypothetical protein